MNIHVGQKYNTGDSDTVNEYVPEDAFHGSLFAAFEQSNDFSKCFMSFEIRVSFQFLGEEIDIIYCRIDGGISAIIVVAV